MATLLVIYLLYRGTSGQLNSRSSPQSPKPKPRYNAIDLANGQTIARSRMSRFLEFSQRRGI